jgi:hypothetical protein
VHSVLLSGDVNKILVNKFNKNEVILATQSGIIFVEMSDLKEIKITDEIYL